MTAEQRRQKISELLEENDSVRVTEPSQLFSVSEVTVRSYLEDMEKKGPLRRVCGDAVMIKQSATRIIAANHTKFGHVAFAKISDISIADYIVTNNGVDRVMLDSLKDAGVEAIIANTPYSHCDMSRQ